MKVSSRNAQEAFKEAQKSIMSGEDQAPEKPATTAKQMSSDIALPEVEVREEDFEEKAPVEEHPVTADDLLGAAEKSPKEKPADRSADVSSDAGESPGPESEEKTLEERFADLEHRYKSLMGRKPFFDAAVNENSRLKATVEKLTEELSDLRKQVAPDEMPTDELEAIREVMPEAAAMFERQAAELEKLRSKTQQDLDGTKQQMLEREASSFLNSLYESRPIARKIASDPQENQSFWTWINSHGNPQEREYFKAIAERPFEYGMPAVEALMDFYARSNGGSNPQTQQTIDQGAGQAPRQSVRAPNDVAPRTRQQTRVTSKQDRGVMSPQALAEIERNAIRKGSQARRENLRDALREALMRSGGSA